MHRVCCRCNDLDAMVRTVSRRRMVARDLGTEGMQLMQAADDYLGWGDEAVQSGGGGGADANDLTCSPPY